MRLASTTAFAALAAAVVLGAPAVSAAADPDALQQAKDRAQIEALMWTYNRALDGLNADAYVEAFTPDGSFGQVKGREALHKMVADLKKGNEDREAKGEARRAMYHIETNQNLEFIDRDHARLHYYWMTLFGELPPKLGANVAAVGHGYDDLVRVNGKWLIQARNVAPKDD